MRRPTPPPDTATHAGDAPPDSEARGLIALLPARARRFAVLARFDRPIGWWLLFWPCAWGVALAGAAIDRWPLIAWLLVGSVAMRGAGCVYNDIVDRDLDARVARTAARPLASGAVSLRAAWSWLAVLAAIGLVVWLQLGWPARLVALGSVVLVAAYPFMKRITWWPQLWLGLVFSWGALVGWVEAGGERWPVLALLYCGAVAWVVGYDTIYALQDVEDDALVGVRSSARRLGRGVRAGVAAFYGAALAAWSAAFWLLFPTPLALAALLPVAVQLGCQVLTLDRRDPASALARFRSNRWAGLAMALACFVVGQNAL